MKLTALVPGLAIAALAVADFGGATEPAGVVSNVLLAQGRTIGSLKERIKVGAEWTVAIEDNGQSEMYFQDLVIVAIRAGIATRASF